MAKRIIRIDKQDGHEEEIDRATLESFLKRNYERPKDILKELDAGRRIASPFAFYELREELNDQ